MYRVCCKYEYMYKSFVFLFIWMVVCIVFFFLERFSINIVCLTSVSYQWPFRLFPGLCYWRHECIYLFILLCRAMQIVQLHNYSEWKCWVKVTFIDLLEIGTLFSKEVNRFTFLPKWYIHYSTSIFWMICMRRHYFRY